VGLTLLANSKFKVLLDVSPNVRANLSMNMEQTFNSINVEVGLMTLFNVILVV